MSDLAEKKCIACEGGVAPLTKQEAEVLAKQVRDWRLSGDARWISKEFACKDFKTAMELANKIGDIAEAEGHHPDLQVRWGIVVVELTTHAIKGLSENDFILAAKIDTIA
jgi:4a-hydroxytetrahydrobiopterin dehydratase